MMSGRKRYNGITITKVFMMLEIRSFQSQISTVGYGDITPKSDWGRAVAILAILAALIILPAQVNNIMQLASRR